MIRVAQSLVILLAVASQVSAHSRWICPKPRSDSSGIKLGSCGNIGSIGDASNQLTIAPGPFTVYFQETITHRGSPHRVALSRPGVDNFESCVLLDHVPHDDQGSANALYGLTVNIPDIACDNCALQLIQFMTDKVSGQCTFNPDDTTSFDNGQCGSNYFSCANVKITGTKPFDPSLCVQPQGFAKNGFLYKSNEAASWTGQYLTNYGDASVRTPVPGVCSRKFDQAIANAENPGGFEPAPAGDQNFLGAIVGGSFAIILLIGGSVFAVVYRKRQARKVREARRQSPIAFKAGELTPATPLAVFSHGEENAGGQYSAWVEPAYAHVEDGAHLNQRTPKLPDL